MEEKDLVELGSATKPHGIKGGFQFNLFNTVESVLKKNEVISIFPKSPASTIAKEGLEIKIENIHFGNKVICYLEDITDRNIVEEMLPFTIYYPREKFPEPDCEFQMTKTAISNYMSTAGFKLVDELQFKDHIIFKYKK